MAMTEAEVLGTEILSKRSRYKEASSERDQLVEQARAINLQVAALDEEIETIKLEARTWLTDEAKKG